MLSSPLIGCFFGEDTGAHQNRIGATKHFRRHIEIKAAWMHLGCQVPSGSSSHSRKRANLWSGCKRDHCYQRTRLSKSARRLAIRFSRLWRSLFNAETSFFLPSTPLSSAIRAAPASFTVPRCRSNSACRAVASRSMLNICQRWYFARSSSWPH